MSSKRIVALTVLVLSILGLFYAITTYSNDTSRLFGYNYQEPLTAHETAVISVGLLSAAGAFIGFIVVCSDSSKSNREYSESDHTEVKAGDSSVGSSISEESCRELERLCELKNAGVLSEEEFNQLKARCLKNVL